MSARTLCIIIPVYNEAEGLSDLLARLSVIADRIATEFGLAIEFIFIDDGSSDDSFTLLKAHDFGAVQHGCSASRAILVRKQHFLPG